MQNSSNKEIFEYGNIGIPVNGSSGFLDYWKKIIPVLMFVILLTWESLPRLFQRASYPNWNMIMVVSCDFIMVSR